MSNALIELVGKGHAGARGQGKQIPELALNLYNEYAPQIGLAQFNTLAEYQADIARRTALITLLAGSGSRWVKSLEAAQALPASARPPHFIADFDKNFPRALYPVKNYIPELREKNIAIGAYSFFALRGWGEHIIVVRGYEKEISENILAPLAIDKKKHAFFTQAPFNGKPLGHGDAAFQCRELWAGKDYVLANFGGDANSPQTVAASLFALDALNVAFKARGEAPLNMLMPVTELDNPSYPIAIDDAGLPRAFGHAKLQGQTLQAGRGYTNVGLRLYRAPALRRELDEFRARFWDAATGYNIPGNDPAGHEFALDNVDASLAQRGEARILAVADKLELSPAKSLDEIPKFEEAIAKVLAL